MVRKNGKKPLPVRKLRASLFRSTFYRWKRKYNPKNLQPLGDNTKILKGRKLPRWGTSEETQGEEFSPKEDIRY